LAKIALLVASLLLTALAFELGLRQCVPPDDRNRSTMRVPHPELGWLPKPGSESRNRNAEFDVQVAYNSKGWRDVEHDYAKPDGVFRIVVLGDSTIEGYSVDFEDSFAVRLQQLLRSSGRRVEVVNIGVGGYGTLQEDLAFELDGRRYEPDLVLLAFLLANDVRNNSRELETRMHRARGFATDMRLANRPFLEPSSDGDWSLSMVDYEGAVRRYRAARRAEETGLKAFLSRNLALYRALRRVVRRASASKDSRAADAEAWMGVYRCELAPAYERAWETTARILERLRDAVRRAGGTLVVFTVPAYHEVDPEHRRIVAGLVPDAEDYCFEEAAGYQRLEAILSEQHVPFLNLLSTFRRADREQGESLYRWSDEHWNPAGHALAAREVAARLEERGLLPPSASPEIPQRGVPE
jgi:lysophospholipase L1-like esterase